ncbi:B3 domain-containing transcription repressor VAL1 isoform X2 [Diospyros lotus]|uniref:B3 domain-containing transcription repressor VAL1 isoform X2 n=1 Tax=Diospyros lotus TaxID=55363 RepID=UPI0022568156|nr:B3 domain-containing transcription repressor VAL1 isoform X2 [Diospyros lotus]
MARICMNEACRATTTPEWKRGWGLNSGGFASLCYNCGSAFEKLVYCDTFHLEESGWRECRLCGKRVHCGCIASKYLLNYLDFGGIACINCANGLETCSVRPLQIPKDGVSNGFGPLTTNNLGEAQSSSFIENRTSGIVVDKGKLMQLSKTTNAKELIHFPLAQTNDTNASIGKVKRDETMFSMGKVSPAFPDPMQQPVRASVFAKPENSRPISVKDVYESLAQPSLSFSLNTPSDTSNSLPPALGGNVLDREQKKNPPLQQVQRMLNILPKHPKTGLSIGSEVNNGMVSQTRVARAPAEGRGRNQLLPRYWPRITDQELQQISGDLNSNIVPLFEKVLSASDAGRIGRLVLPKACAEMYFPSISQSDGLPIQIRDVKGKEWTFQFRFWPNNNSRMYVLEGVTPCIQNMQLQAGDTVTFSRIDPGGKLVMGFRKALHSIDMQDSQTSFVPNGAHSGETLPAGPNDNLTTHGGGMEEESSHRPVLIQEKKRTRNIGCKSKRLLMHSEDAVELQLTWGEAQELFRPPPSAKPTIVVIEEHEFEEYDEPPVFGKRTFFTTQVSGEQEQWAQCDTCSKWRRLPVDVLLPPKWTCSENIWDLSRCSCSAPNEMNPKELESLLKVGKDFKRQRMSPKTAPEDELSGLDALATAAVLGDDAVNMGEPSAGATTRHPRHRPGCTCIVCIQPPSGKGRHKPTCICNVCMTVKRRFKTLMLRKKKRQSEREAEIAQGRDLAPPKDEYDTEMEGGLGHAPLYINQPEDESIQNRVPKNVAETGNGRLDLNCHPNREEEMPEIPLKLNERMNEGPCSLPEAAGESEGPSPDDESRLSTFTGENVNVLP